MLNCETCRERLPQYVADHEPAGTECDALRRHLASCADCAAYHERLVTVEAALSRMPRMIPSTTVRAHVIAMIAQEGRSAPPWQWLPWTVWLPALALIAALAIAWASLLHPELQLATLPDLETVVQPLNVPAPIPTLARVDWSSDRATALYIGILLSLAGFGIMLSLARWSPANSRRLEHLEDQAERAAERWLHRRRRQA